MYKEVGFFILYYEYCITYSKEMYLPTIWNVQSNRTVMIPIGMLIQLGRATAIWKKYSFDVDI